MGKTINYKLYHILAAFPSDVEGIRLEVYFSADIFNSSVLSDTLKTNIICVASQIPPKRICQCKLSVYDHKAAVLLQVTSLFPASQPLCLLCYWWDEMKRYWSLWGNYVTAAAKNWFQHETSRPNLRTQLEDKKWANWNDKKKTSV